jgi:hypothetical protein
MSTIVDKLNLLLENKNAIKAVLEEKGKEPSDVLSTYAQSISELDNEEQVSYVLSNADGSKKIYAQLSSKEPITLTATENDIRLGSTAITNEGFVEGTKDIPSYYSGYGSKMITAGSEAVIKKEEYDYKSIMITIAPYDAATGSTSVNYVSVSDAMYEAKTTTKLSDITINEDEKQVNLGITVDVLSVMRYFIVREEA